jgi:phage/plasmid-associated DNA primase
VLRWAVEDARRWRDEGGLLVPDDVKIKTREHRIREDAIGEFIEECMEKTEGAMTSLTDVWSAYESWCAKQGVAGKQRLDRTTLLGKIEDRLGVTRKR